MGRGRLKGPPRLAHPKKSAHPVPRGNAAQRPVPGAAERPSPGSRVDRSAEADGTLRSGCCRCPVSSDSKVLCSAACAPDNRVTSPPPREPAGLCLGTTSGARSVDPAQGAMRARWGLSLQQQSRAWAGKSFSRGGPRLARRCLGVETPSRWPCFPRESRTPSLHTAGEMGLLFISVHSWVTRSQSREKLAPGGPLTITRGHQGPRADRGTCRARARPPPRR